MTPTPYWQTRVPNLKDIRERLKDVLLGVPFDPTNTDYTPTSAETQARSNFANCTKVISSFQFLKEDLTSETPPVLDGRKPDFSKLKAYVMKDSTNIIKDSNTADICNYALEARDTYMCFVCYPIRTQTRGAVSAYVLDDISQRIMAGFNGAHFGRSFGSYAQGIEWYDVDSNWAVMEVTIVVPYTVGSMDNPNIRGGENWSIEVGVQNRNTGFSEPLVTYYYKKSAGQRPDDIPAPTLALINSGVWRRQDDFGSLQPSEEVYASQTTKFPIESTRSQFSTPVVSRTA